MRLRVQIARSDRGWGWGNPPLHSPTHIPPSLPLFATYPSPIMPSPTKPTMPASDMMRWLPASCGIKEPVVCVLGAVGTGMVRFCLCMTMTLPAAVIILRSSIHRAAPRPPAIQTTQPAPPDGLGVIPPGPIGCVALAGSNALGAASMRIQHDRGPTLSLCVRACASARPAGRCCG